MAKKTNPWLPKQHGAWLLLLIPFIVGAVQAVRAGQGQLWFYSLFAAEFLGYLAFATFSTWLHASPRQRPRYRKPLACYSVLVAINAFSTIVMAGPEILWWLIPGLPLIALALYYVWTRNERALGSGIATVALASGIGLVLRFGTITGLLHDARQAIPDLAVQGIIFCYSLGTIFHVKSLIRECQNPNAWYRSLAYHGLVLAVAIAGVLAGALGIWWIGFGVILLARAYWLPRIAKVKPVKPLQVGQLEIVISLALLVSALIPG